jgi:hypothetical protein
MPSFRVDGFKLIVNTRGGKVTDRIVTWNTLGLGSLFAST